MSDRIIDCPANVIVIAADCGLTAALIAHTIANRIAGRTDLANNQPVWNIVAICVVLAFSCDGSMYSRSAEFLPFKLKGVAPPLWIYFSFRFRNHRSGRIQHPEDFQPHGNRTSWFQYQLFR
jgi:hypothetical protein